jgi:hypothetical protein
MNDDSSGIGEIGPDPKASASISHSTESGELTKLIVDGFEPVDPHPDVWHRIDTQLWGRDRPQNKHRQLRHLAMAAAIVLLIAMTGGLATMALRDGADVQPTIAAQTSVVRDLSNPATGDVALTIHTKSDGSSIAVTAESLPILEPGSTYQLWSVAGDEIVSVAVFGPSIGSAPMHLEGDPAVLALTIETTGGVAVSSATPIATWTTTG